MASLETERLVTLLVRETGWSLEYVLGMPVTTARRLYQHLSYQRAIDTYSTASNFAMMLANYFSAHSKSRRFKVSDFIGQPPTEGQYISKRGDTMTDKPKEATITLTDGKTYTLSPMTVEKMGEVEDKFDEAYLTLLQTNRMKVLGFIVYEMLKDNHSGVAPEYVAKHLTAKIITAKAKEIKDLIGG